jgi:hypothetical protein
MIKITGIGNGKNLLMNLIKNRGSEVEAIRYDEQILNLEKGNDDTVLIVYDGFCIEEFLEMAPSIKEVQHIPIFLMATNFYVFGINKMENGVRKVGACPSCVTKQTINKSFNLNLYDHLIKQKSFKSVEESYGKELDHFILLLLEMLEKGALFEKSFSYLVHGNTYSMDKMPGLSKCSICDNTNYDNTDLEKVLKEVL